jgi:hypothetical protein
MVEDREKTFCGWKVAHNYRAMSQEYIGNKDVIHIFLEPFFILSFKS